MFFGEDISQYAFLFMVAIAVGGVALSILYPYFTGSAATSKRVKAVADGIKSGGAQKMSLRQRLLSEDPKDARRKQLQDSLSQVEEVAKERKKRLTLRLMIQQAGLETTPRAFWIFSIALGGGS